MGFATELTGELESQMRIVSSKLGVTRMVVIALAVIIVAGVIITTYIALHQSTSPTSSVHTVDWATMANRQTDFWNITVTNPYTVVLTDAMTVSSGNQNLEVDAYSSPSAQFPAWIVIFVTNATFNFYVYTTNGSIINSGSYLPCNNGVVQIAVTRTQIAFTGTSPVTSDIPFENLVKIVTFSNGGSFNGGQLDMTLTS